MDSLLTPFTQYYLRRLLRPYMGNGACLKIAGIDVERHWHNDLNQRLLFLYPHPGQLHERVRELEILVRMHQGCATSESASDEASLAGELEGKILDCLGIHIPTIVKIVATKTGINCWPDLSRNVFRFYQAAAIHQGIRHDNNLYVLVYDVPVIYQLQAYEIAILLSQYNESYLLSASASSCQVWLNLRSPIYLTMHHQGVSRLEGVSHLYALICGWRKDDCLSA